MVSPAKSAAKAGTAARDHRIALTEGYPFDPTSLVGSFFLAGPHEVFPDRGWQGCIVAQPRPGLYLVELFSWLMGESTDQRLVPIEHMMSWLFYDDAEWMRNSYEHGVRQTWDRRRVELGQEPLGDRPKN